ncbi:CD3324 family protein [Natronospora cellulosivora (SeqCode)]
MSYKNGKDILPETLLQQIQEYAEGEIIYIPKRKNNHAGWGEISGTRDLLRKRNQKIYTLYKEGIPVGRIKERFHLSEESIKKIVANI